MAEARTFGELYKAKSVTEADLDAAVDAYMTDPTMSAFIMGEGHVLDLAAAVQASPFAKRMLADPAMRDALKRTAVRAAILLAQPAKGSATTSRRHLFGAVWGRRLEALRACAPHPHGGRRGAYPSATPVLVAQELVENCRPCGIGGVPKGLAGS